MKDTKDRTEESVNPATMANGVRDTPMPNNDEQLVDDDGSRRDLTENPTREEIRALSLGSATTHATFGDGLTDDVLPHSATHAGHEAWLVATEPIRRILEETMELAAQLWAAHKSVPHHSIDHRRKWIANSAKVGFIVGDTAVLGDQLYRASTPLFLAIVVGLSLAVTVVLIGAQCGHELQAANQRVLRGPAPDDAPPTVLNLHDSSEGGDVHRFWLNLAYVAAATMFLALFALSRGSGDPDLLSVGYGLLGSLTVAGSGCAEAYSTNDAAEQLQGAKGDFDSAVRALHPWSDAETQSAAAGTSAGIYEEAARHDAVASGTTVSWIGNRLPDAPEVGGYIDGGHIAAPSPAPQPLGTPLAITPRSIQRDRQRPKYSLQSAMTTEADEASTSTLTSDVYAAPRPIDVPSSSNGNNRETP